MSEKEEQPPSNPNFGYPPVSSYEPPPPYAQEDHTKFDHGNIPVGGQSPFQPSPGQPPHSQGQFPNSYPPSAPTMTTVIVSNCPAVVGPYPVNCQCPNCNAHILTETRPVTGTITWLVCAGCLLFGCWLGCCLVPFCANSLQDVEHRCPQCKHFLGRYRRV